MKLSESMNLKTRESIGTVIMMARNALHKKVEFVAGAKEKQSP